MRRLALLALLLVSSCTVGPNYRPPETQVPPAFAEPQPPADQAVDLARWWNAFNDAELDRLVTTALAQNLDVRQAASRVRQARAGIAAARARLLPEVDAMGNATNIHFSKNAGLSSLESLFGGSSGNSGGASGTGSGGGGAQQGGIAPPGSGITTYAIGFDASWEIDLFGGARRGVEAARARTEAAIWQARDTQVTLAAEVADAYLTLRTLQQREAVLRAEVARQSRALDLMVHTAQAGLVPQGDTIRQRSTLAAAEAGIEPVVAEEHIEMHALGLLVGRPPESLLAELQAPAGTTPLPPAVPPGLPSDLLRRRPDIRAAERNLAAATADIGVAVADLYPHFSLTGVAELISTALSSLLSPHSFQSVATGQGLFPVLDFGRRRAQVNIRKEQAQQAYLDYQKIVLGALKDVEDALARVDAERRRNDELRGGVADAERALAAVDARYRSGLVDLSAVLQAQQAVLSARDTLAQSDGALRQNLVSLYKALGGGWDPEAKPA
ncbi:MAG TPA: efflux transporter outer membrane subunit [Allosphingosinicella sp.]|jgi:NodT family efflux transporter outer membrane factor (OMF) lipoprotein